MLEGEQEFSEMKRTYEQILSNYAVSIEQLNRYEGGQGQEIIKSNFMQSLVKMEVDEEEEGIVRNKQHTFGFKSGRDSRESRG